MQDVIFGHISDKPYQPQPPIHIYTTGSASQDLQALIGRIDSGDTPGTRELLAILDSIRMDIERDEL